MYHIIWLDDEFLDNGEKKGNAFEFMDRLKQLIELKEANDKPDIKPCASYEIYEQCIKEKTPHAVILDVECYDKEDDIARKVTPSSDGFYKAKQLADSHQIPVIVFTGTRPEDGSHKDFRSSVQNCAYVLQKMNGVPPLYKALYEGYDGKSAVLVNHRFPDYPFLDQLLNHGYLPCRNVIKDQNTVCALQGILKDYEHLTSLKESDYRNVETNQMGNIRTIIEYIFTYHLKEDFSEAIPFNDHSPRHFSNMNQFGLGLWLKHVELGNDTIPDEVKLAFLYVWDGSCAYVHASSECYTPPVFESLINSLQVKRMVYDSFVIIMKWFAIYKMEHMKPRNFKQLLRK